MEAAAVAAGYAIVLRAGDGGIADDAECVAVDLKSLESMTALATRLQPDLTVVGPELPLTLGVVDEFARRGWRAFGPTRAAAQLEASKSFAKEFLQRHHIPTAPRAVLAGLFRSLWSLRPPNAIGSSGGGLWS